MSSSENIISSLTANEIRLLVLGTVCTPVKMDFDKLANLAGIKRASAGAMWGRAKIKLERALGDELDSIESPTKTTKAKNVARSRKKNNKTEPVEEPAAESEMEGEPVVDAEASEDD
ncbi:hypothetical protein N7452_001571 [Penicillium brevicompactum]|uniref:Uncharacterized protein n=1 Tax=Penicillium brevicompactum TaxID=5074 RepID=A0A9W9R2M1_PENBR|nr:hypothetical protein N7452_001571 [Penicillium brevicompactum]